MNETQTVKCPTCDFENDPRVKICPKCEAYLKPEVECVRSIDTALADGLAKLRYEAAQANASLKTIEYIAIWFLILSFLGIVLAIMEGAGVFR